MQKLPKVLVIDVNAWREDSGSNTLMDIFRCWDPNRLALVYTSSQIPNTNVCQNFFQISENQVLKSVFKPHMKVGCSVVSSCSNDTADAKLERVRYARAHKNHSKWMRLAREFVWKLGHWRTQDLRKFVMNFDPDVIFVPIFPYPYMGRIQEYIIKITGKPTVCYLADDNYSYDACSDIIDYVHRFWTRQYVGPLSRNSSQMFVIVDKEKEDTDARFGTDSIILTKSIDFKNKFFLEREYKTPIRFVYTGSLTIGRDKTLAYLADAINKVNDMYTIPKAELFIYSQTTVDSSIMNRIERRYSHFCGCVPYQEIQHILQESDVVVFAEALDGKESNIAKLSFSTKITDYISNGKCVLAIGKRDIAPIDYFIKHDSALVACSVEDILSQVSNIIDNPSIINQYGRKAFQCAVDNHEKEMMTRRFIETIQKAVELSKMQNI